MTLNHRRLHCAESPATKRTEQSAFCHTPLLPFPRLSTTPTMNRSCFLLRNRALVTSAYRHSFSSASSAFAGVVPKQLGRFDALAPSAVRRHMCAAAADMGHLSVAPTDEAVKRNADKDAVAVVVGASRGIGLAVVQALVSRWKGRIVATCRNVDEAGALGALWQFMPDRFTVLSMDVCDEESIKKAVAEIKDIGSEPRVDLVFHSAGVLHADGKMPETSLSKVDADFMRRNLETNLMGPVLVAKHLSPLMITHRKKGRVPSVLAAISARVGSISDNNLGGWLSYRASKAGQNQAMRTMSIELGRRGIICVSLHPGTVRTDLSAPFQSRVPETQLQDVDVAAGRLLDVLDSVGQDDNGGFFAYDGQRIPY